MDLTSSQQQIIDKFCANEMRGLKRICYPKIRRVCGDANMDDDDIYSIAMDVLIDSVRRYDISQGKFETFLSSNIQNKINTYIRDTKYRSKRSNVQKDENGRNIYVPNIPIDAPTDEGLDIVERIDSGFQIEDELPEEIGFSSDERVEKYFKTLSDRQRRIANLIMQGYPSVEIKEKLKLTEKQYIDALKDMRAFEKSRILKHVDYVQIEGEEPMQTQTLEKSKPDKLSIASIIKKIDNYTIRFDHPLQRASEQWNPAMKGNLISDILQRNPIPPLVFAEQVANGLAIIWDLDGKQRCTNVYAFKNDGFKITKNIRRWNISYQARVKENGKQVLDENGFPESERREFDIRGKKFSDLPEELQDRFLEYNFEIVQYLNCSSEDIAYHIARYNEGKPMSASQKGITRLGEEFAAIVKSISAMPFFKEQGGYKVSEGSNGTVNRVVVESVMAANFLSDWKKKQEDMCEFIKANATTEMFDDFEDMVGRISKVGTEETLSMFDSKDSFIWFGLYARFVNTGLEDEKFIDFMAEFARSLHSKEVDGVSYDVINETRATKDKNVVTRKIEHLAKLMNSYFNLNAVDESNDVTDILEFVKDTVSSDVTDEDIELYENILDDCIKLNAPIRSDKNIAPLIALTAFSCQKEIDQQLADWLSNIAMNKNVYSQNPKENFIHMKQDFLKHINKKGAVA